MDYLRLVRVVLVLLAILIFILLNNSSNYLIYLSLVIIFLLSYYYKVNDDSLSKNVFISIATLYLLPYALFTFYKIEINLAPLAGIVILIQIFILFLKRDVYGRNIIKFKTSLTTFLLIFAIAMLGGLVHDFFPMTAFGVMLVFIESSIVDSNYKHLKIYLFFYIISIIMYVLFLWGGFGRIVLAGYVFMPIFILFQYRFIKFNTYLITILIIIGTIAGKISRFGEFEGFEGLLEDSSAHHLIIVNDLLRDSSLTNNIGELFSQFQLMFLNWIPRVAWAGKPLGAGWTIVTDYFGREGVDEGYSVSLGFFGEHIAYNPSFWLLSSILTFYLYIKFRVFIVNFSKGYYSTVIIYDILFTSLLWGGMGTFGSRVWFSIVPAQFFLYLKIKGRNKFK